MDSARADGPAIELPGEAEVTATDKPADTSPAPGEQDGQSPLSFDRHLVLEQLGGWRGMVDATLPTVAFIVANSLNGLRTGIWAALGAALLVFLLRLVRRQSVQQAVSGLFAVGIAVAIAAASGQARDFFVLGIVRNAVIGLVLLGSIAFRRPLVGVIAEFLAPSHLGSMASASLPGLRKRFDSVRAHLHKDEVSVPARGEPDPEPDCHWRDDPRMLRAYNWLTVMWGGVFLLRVVVQAPLYYADEVEWLGTLSLLLGLPLTAVEIVVTFWVVSRLHRHRCPAPTA
jgi:zinc transporter ZupT